ncbi:MAG TPA: preprotein translocase subunit YajC [Coriobacteriia bacterium]|nr:preprotein translocase subunit YajC [Coriobacteriia bacterium]
MNQTTQLIFLAVMVGAFWFLIMRPQQQRQKQQREMLSELKAGDEIVTIGGIFGTVVDAGDRIRVRTVGGTEFEIAPQAIANVVAPEDDADDADVDEDVAEDVEMPELAEGDDTDA